MLKIDYRWDKCPSKNKLLEKNKTRCNLLIRNTYKKKIKKDL